MQQLVKRLDGGSWSRKANKALGASRLLRASESEVGAIQTPDPRLPSAPVEYQLWEYEENTAHPAVDTPAPEVAAAVAERANRERYDFMLTVGDNFYPAGVFSTDDPQWTSAWEDVYDDPALDVPVYAILGNHDHSGFPLEQLKYARRNDRWTMPDLYYSWSERLADGTRVDFFALDTD